jgi:hypothetical protein
MQNVLDTIQHSMNVMDDVVLVDNVFVVILMIEEILFLYVRVVIMEVFVNITRIGESESKLGLESTRVTFF